MRTRPLHPSSLLTEADLRNLYKVYRDANLSTYDLARMIWQDKGYGSVETCATAIYKGFKRKNWKLRSRSESRRLALQARGHSVGREARREKRRERYLRERGQARHQPRCAASTKRGPCRHPAAIGSLVCAWHRGVTAEKRCPATNARGEQCRLPRTKGSKYCNKHVHLEEAAA